MKDKQIGTKLIINSFLWKFLERLFSQGLNLIVQIILARILLPSDFGSLAIIIAVTNFATIFVQSGLATALIQKKDLDDGDVSTMLTGSLLIALLLFIILFLLAPWISLRYNMPQLNWPLRVLSLTLFLSAINSVQTAILTREMVFKTIFIRTMCAVPVAGTVGIVMALSGFGLWALVAHNLVNTLVLVLVMAIGCKYKFRLGFSVVKAKELYSFSLKILATSLVSGFGDTLRALVIGKKYSTEDLSYYDKAITYSGYVTLIANATIQGVMLPTFSKKQDDLYGLKRMMRKSSRLTAFIMFPVLLWVIVCAHPIVILLLTSKWAPCIPFLMVFCLMRIPGCIATLDKQAFYAVGRSDIGFYYEIVLLVVNVGLLFITVPIGIGAIAVGVTLVEFLGTIVIFVFAKEIFGYKYGERIKDLYKPSMNSIIMASIVWSISLIGLNMLLMLMCQVIVGCVVYYLLAQITRDDSLQYIKHNILEKIRQQQ